MSDKSGWVRNRWAITGGVALLAVMVGMGIGGLINAHRAPANRGEIEAVVRQYILDHPEILPEAMDRLHNKQSETAYLTSKAALEKPFGSAWAGAEKGDVTLVMFTDYACGYCRASVPDVDRLIAENPRLKVVWREVPVLGPQSEMAARVALSVAVQGRFIDFHRRMFAMGSPDPAKVTTVLRALAVDPRRIEADARSAAVTSELRNNIDLATRLTGALETPTFVVNGTLLKGAVGYEALKQAVAEARQRQAQG